MTETPFVLAVIEFDSEAERFPLPIVAENPDAALAAAAAYLAEWLDEPAPDPADSAKVEEFLNGIYDDYDHQVQVYATTDPKGTDFSYIDARSN
jgi:hypothetical protein